MEANLLRFRAFVASIVFRRWGPFTIKAKKSIIKIGATTYKEINAIVFSRSDARNENTKRGRRRRGAAA